MSDSDDRYAHPAYGDAARARRDTAKSNERLASDLTDAHKEIEKLEAHIKKMARTDIKHVGHVEAIVRDGSTGRYQVIVDTGTIDRSKLPPVTIDTQIWVETQSLNANVGLNADAIVVLSSQLTEANNEIGRLNGQLRIARQERDLARDKAVAASDQLTKIHDENAALRAEIQALSATLSPTGPDPQNAGTSS